MNKKLKFIGLLNIYKQKERIAARRFAIIRAHNKFSPLKKGKQNKTNKGKAD